MTESINLDMEEINIATDVLVIGGGFTGIKAASEIAGLGYKVILIEADAELGSQKGPNFLVDLNREDLKGLQDLENKIEADANIQVLTQTRLIRSAGVTGDFTVELAKGEESVEHKVGAIVVASDFSVEALNEKYGLVLTENVLAQSQLEALLASDNGTGKAKLAGKTVAFLVGFGQEGNPLVMERVMRSVLAIEEIDECTPYVYVGDLKVASDGLERMYKQGREKGALYFKLEAQPNIIDNGKTISFYDSAARRNLELSPDLVVV